VLRQLTRLVPPGLFAGRHGGTDAELRVGWRIAGLLAVSQTVGYGVLYYSFSVFLTPIAGTLHASATAVTGALTASLLAGAAAAVPVGRHLDRHGGRGLMTWGSAAGTLLVVAWSQVHDLAELYVVWVLLGIVSAVVLYEAAFAAVVSWFDAERRGGALLAVTVVAGFASTIFLPLSGWLEAAYGWRTAVLVLAAVHAVQSGMPSRFRVSRWRRRPPNSPSPSPSATARSRPRSGSRSPPHLSSARARPRPRTESHRDLSERFARATSATRVAIYADTVMGGFAGSARPVRLIASPLPARRVR